MEELVSKERTNEVLLKELFTFQLFLDDNEVWVPPELNYKIMTYHYLLGIQKVKLN